MILVKFIIGILFFLVLILVAPIKYDLRIKFKDKAKIFFCAKFFFGIVKYKNDGLKIFGISVKKNIIWTNLLFEFNFYFCKIYI